MCLCARSLQSCLTLCDPVDHRRPVSSVLGILQARILERIAISSFRKSFWPRDHICVSYISCIGGQVLYHQHHLGNYTPHIPVCNTILAYSDQPHKTFFFWFLDMEIILLLFAIPFACSTLLQGQVLLFTSLEIIFFILFFFFFFYFFIYLPPLSLIWCFTVWTSLVAQRLKSRPAMRETWVQSLGQEDPLEKEMATYTSILAWRIPWMEEPGGLQSTGSQRVGHDWATSLLSFLYKIKFKLQKTRDLWTMVSSATLLCFKW